MLLERWKTQTEASVYYIGKTEKHTNGELLEHGDLGLTLWTSDIRAFANTEDISGS